ncbi:MAG: hypothetical protein WC523_01115 [Patescibacteria group bacterium]|jgi:hypothetical protein
MLGRNNQYDLFPEWRRGPVLPDSQSLENSTPPGEEKKLDSKEKTDSIIENIYQKIDDARKRREKAELEASLEAKSQNPEPDSKKQLPEKDEDSSSDYQDYKTRQYKN